MYVVVEIPSDQWVNINTLSSIPVGTELEIENLGVSYVLLQEGTSQPNSDNENGVIITTIKEDNAYGEILSGSLDIWAKSTQEITGKLALTEK